MIISNRLKYCFVSNRKCATNTMYKILTENYDGVHVGSYHENRTGLFSSPDLFHWTIVRNPYTRAVSTWASTCLRNNGDRYWFRRSIERQGGNPDIFMDFMELLLNFKPGLVREEWLVKTQYEWLKGIKFDRVLKIENLSEEFNELPFVKQKGGALSLPFENSTHKVRKDFREYLNKETMAMVEEWAYKDFQEYGYETGRIE